MNRPRNIHNLGLPPNLYADKSKAKVYYKYINPITKKSHSMGTDRRKAIQAAKILNAKLMQPTDLVETISGNQLTIQKFIDTRFVQIILPEHKLGSRTLSGYLSQLNIIKKKLGRQPFHLVTVKSVADFLNTFPATTSNRYRSLLSLVFKYAVAEGLCDNNPVESTIKRAENRKRRRLTKEWFDLIYESSLSHFQKEEQFLRNAMDIGLITLQRRADIVRMKFSDCKKEAIELLNKTIVEKEFLYVVQQKTAKHANAAFIKIEIGEEMKKLIKRCRDSFVSPYLIHHNYTRKMVGKTKDHHSQVTPDFLSKAFATARDRLELFQKMPNEERPTFHEIRSLGIKLYKDRGIDPKRLAGHATEQMQKHYQKGHIIWTEVACL